MSHFRLQHFSLLAALALVGACGEIVESSPEPRLELRGTSIGADPLGRADLAIDFGTVFVGSLSNAAIVATNTGSALLEVVGGERGALPEFVSLGFEAFSLPPGAQREFDLSVHPREAGPFEAIVALGTNEPRGEVRIRLHGEGILPKLSCAPRKLDFGDVVRTESRSLRVGCYNNLDVPIQLALGAIAGAGAEHFAATFVDDTTSTVEVGPGRAVDIDLTFAPGADASIGPVAVSLPVEDASGETLLGLDLLATVAPHALQLLTESMDGALHPLEGCFGFPPTDLGKEETATLYVRNLSQGPVHIQSVALQGQDGNFWIVSPTTDGAIPVAPRGGAEVEVVLAYAPTSTGKHEAHLIIRSDDALEPGGANGGVRACIEGQERGAQIDCAPSTLAFGPVAIGTTVTRTYTCTISAPLREGAIPPPLYVSSVDSTDPSFVPSLRHADGSPAPANAGYLPGDAFYLDVAYTPLAERVDTADIVIANTSTEAPHHKTQVFGEGKDLPACDFELRPASLDFGVVTPHSSLTLPIEIRNNGETACVISGVRLGGGSDPAFTLGPIEYEEEGWAIIEGHGSLSIPVTFTPTEYASSLTGSVEFTLSAPSDPEQSIPLSGSATPPCLVFEPESMDFGSRYLLCSTHETSVSMVNDCAAPLSIDALSLGSGQGQFTLEEASDLPVVLSPGERTEFSVAFAPDHEGIFHGGVLVEVSDPESGADLGPYVFQMEGRGVHGTMQTDTFVQGDQSTIFSLRAHPADVNADEVFDDADIEVVVGELWTPSVSPLGQRVWRYDLDDNAIVFNDPFIPAAGDTIAVTYQVECWPR